MKIFKDKKKKVKKCPKENAGIKKAEEISDKYRQLSKCCEVIASVRRKNQDDYLYHTYTGGWRLYATAISSAGIDMEEVYSHIERLANKKRAELELELSELE